MDNLKEQKVGVEIDFAGKVDPLEDTFKEIEKLKQQQDNLYQIIHNKGLEVGMPRRIRDSINKLIGMLNKIDEVWDSKENQKKDEDFETEINLLINKGNLPSAVLRMRIQIAKSKENMEGVRMFLNLLTFELNRLNDELEKQERRQ